MSPDRITASIEQGVMKLRFNRAEKRNAITREMYSELVGHVRLGAADPQVRVVLLLGHQDCFSAGNDFGDFRAGLAPKEDSSAEQFMLGLASFPKPVVAAPCGIAIGIGATLLLHCDLVYCGETTRFRFPFVNLGICPEFASTYLLPLNVGLARASEVLLLGEAFDAQAALSMGIVSRIMDNNLVEDFALQQAQKLASMAPNAIRTTKGLIRRWQKPQTLAAIKAEMEAVRSLLTSPEAAEALSAVAESRKPNFSSFT